MSWFFKVGTILYFSGIVTMALPSPEAQAKDHCEHPRISEERSDVCTLTNSRRAKYRQAPLILDEALSRIAQSHAMDMLARDYFSHESPDGGTMKTRFDEAEIEYGWAGENIAKGQKTPAEVMSDWMKSSGHRRNILQKKFRRIGVGKAGDLWVQVFTD